MHLYTKSWASQQPEIDPGGSPQDRGLKQLESRKNYLSLSLCVSITKSWASQQPEIDPGGSPQDRGLKQLESRKNSLSWPSHDWKYDPWMGLARDEKTHTLTFECV